MCVFGALYTWVQVVATVAQMTWARGTEAALRSPTPTDAMKQWLKAFVEELNKYDHGLTHMHAAYMTGFLGDRLSHCMALRLIQCIQGSLTKLARKVIVALVTTDVHARDIIEEVRAQCIPSVLRADSAVDYAAMRKRSIEHWRFHLATAAEVLLGCRSR
jgi:hypothetical protein